MHQFVIWYFKTDRSNLYVFELFDMMKYKSVPYVTLRSTAVSSNSNELDFSSTGIIYSINYFLLQILLFFCTFLFAVLGIWVSDDNWSNVGCNI